MSNIDRLNSAIVATLALVLLAEATPASAYMGAGAGLSAIGSALSFVGVLLLMVVGFVWYPIKRLLRGKRADATQNDAAE